MSCFQHVLCVCFNMFCVYILYNEVRKSAHVLFVGRKMFETFAANCRTCLNCGKFRTIPYFSWDVPYDSAFGQETSTALCVRSIFTPDAGHC